VDFLSSLVDIEDMKSSSELTKLIPKALKRLRTSKGISQEELANMANLDRTYISGFERGIRNVTILSLEKIIKALNIDAKGFAKEILIQADIEDPK